jgi:hypothetical protein
VKLYHYTSILHVPSIFNDGFLKTTESNVSRKRGGAGPDVVWLTTNPDLRSGNGLDMGINALTNVAGFSKTKVRFSVEVDKRSVHQWREWAGRYAIEAVWMAGLANVGGSGTWRVVERPIPASQWTEVRDTETGADLLAGHPPARCGIR